MTATVELWEHFRRLFDFRGREDRASFWPYAGLVYGLMTIMSVVVIFAVVSSLMPVGGTFGTDAGAPFFPGIDLFFVGMALLLAVTVLLYAAAIVRRLHDGGLSGFWALMPVPFLLFSIVRMWSLFGSFGTAQPEMGSFHPLFASNLMYILTVIALIVLLARRSDPQPNRHDRLPTV